jgi:predicted phosphoribosyltransferase
VDDGVVTGATMRAAILGLRQLEVGLIVAAVPTAAMSTVEEMQPDVDEFIALITSEKPTGIRQWYTDGSPTTDEAELRRLSEFPGRFNLPITL